MGNFSFSQVPRASIQRSTFNRSHNHKTTFDAGFLVPVLVDEVLPGDTFKVRGNIFARLATPIVPVMDDIYLDFFFFFVPNRLLWTNWERFMGQQDNPDDSIDFLVPTLDAGALTPSNVGTIYDYFGLPIGIGSAKPVLDVNALPFRAYNRIWNEWFRDQNLQDSITVPLGDGPDNPTTYALKRRGKRHDYFTSCLPWPQKGPSSMVPIIAEASGAGPEFTVSGLANPPGSGMLSAAAAGSPADVTWVSGTTSHPGGALEWLDPRLGATINTLRQAFQIQRLLERDARGGTRYIELLKSHFGVTSPDYRLQRSEYLGGGEIQVNINPVAQTSGSPSDLQTGYSATPQANLAAYGTVGGKVGFTKSFTEHGYIIGLMSARTPMVYQQGVNRMWRRRTRYDFYWPAFASLGEQAVLGEELNHQGSDAVDKAVWGYQERWAEYRYFPSKVTGKFRTGSDPAPLDFWHLAQDFGATTPVLGPAFIEENPPIARIIAVPSEPHFLFDSYWDMQCTRPMPTYSIPGMADHF